MLAAIVNVSPTVGYPVVFILIALETMGIPLPGETALIAAGLYAHDGHLSIEVVLLLAAGAAILGDNVGFYIGRRWGRRAFMAAGPFHGHRLRLLEVGQPFFARHGPKAVFLGRWVSGLRIASAWLAGINRMEWPVFVFWNALGGICWAVSVGLGAYYIGHAFEKIVSRVGVGAAVVVGVAVVAVLVWRHLRERRRPPREPKAANVAE